MQARTPYPRLPHSTSRHPHRLNPSIVSHGLCRSPLKRVWLFLCLLHPHKPPSPCARFTKPPPAPVTSSFAFYAHTYAYTGGINMCVCTRGYQTSHARAITNVGRSQLHRFIAVTADLRVAVIKTKKKKKEREGEQIEITAAGYPKDGDYRRLNEKPDTLWAFQRERPTPMLYRVCFRRFFFLAEFYEDFLFHTGHSYSVISISFG